MKNLCIMIVALSLATISFGSVAAEPQSTKLSGLQEWIDQGRFIKANGYKIFLVTAGKAKTKGHGVLIVHGFPGSSWDWSGVVPQLAKRTRVVVPDMVGFGRSDKPQTGTFEDFY